MDLAVTHPSFSRRKLVVQTTGPFSRAKVILDGEIVRRSGSSYNVLDDLDREASVRLKTYFGDPVPVLLVNGETVRIARQLTWLEYAWIGVPFLLGIVVGGALGGGIGTFALYANSYLMRSSRAPFARYLLTGAISITSGLAFMAAAAALRGAIRLPAH